MNATTRLLAHIGIVVTCASSTAWAQNLAVGDSQPTGAAAQSVLASAKNLYAAASYEAALVELSSADASEDIDQIDIYRALCQLALDRPQDAERTLEKIVTRKPLYTMNDAQYSPRLVAMFRDVRKRALPGAVQQLYTAAKNEYDGKNYALAAAKFRQLFLVLSDPDVSDKSGTLADLKELADGFLRLSEQKMAEAGPARIDAAPLPASPLAAAPPGRAPLASTTSAATPPPAARVAPATASASPTARAAAQISYTSLDVDVRPPVAIDQTLPSWKPPQQTQYLRNRTYVGQLEILIDEQGTVESATVVKSVWPSYDPAVLQAAKHWRYQPAMKDGKPVRFTKYLDITVAAGGTTPRP